MIQTEPPILDYAPPRRREARFVLWILCITCLLVGTPIWFILLRGFRILNSDPILIGGWAVLGAVIVAIAVLLKTTPPDAIRLSPRASKWIVVLGAVGLQGAALSLLSPALSEDVVRYRLDGLMWIERVSAYATTPQKFLSTSDRADVVDAMVTFPHMNTIYPPVAQATFVLARSVEEPRFGSRKDSLIQSGTFRDWALWDPMMRPALMLRLVFALASVCATALLVAALASLGRSPWWAILFGWNPLVVIETGGMGHVDILGVLFVLLVIRLLQSSRPIGAAVMLALATGLKPIALLLVPFLARDARQVTSRARAIAVSIIFIICLIVIFVPALAYQHGYRGWLRTSRLYATAWEANSSIYELIKSTANSSDGVAVQRAKDRARALALVAVVATMVGAWVLRADLVHAGYWIYLIALLTAPVVYPWYLLWILCLVPLLRGWAGMTALVWSATIGISYLLWRTSDWVLPARFAVLEYAPVYAMLAVELAMLARFRAQRHA